MVARENFISTGELVHALVLPIRVLSQLVSTHTVNAIEFVQNNHCLRAPRAVALQLDEAPKCSEYMIQSDCSRYGSCHHLFVITNSILGEKIYDQDPRGTAESVR